MTEAEIRQTIVIIQKRVEPAGWVTITEKRREGRVDEIHLAVSFKLG
jgi:hypothetical protein